MVLAPASTIPLEPLAALVGEVDSPALGTVVEPRIPARRDACQLLGHGLRGWRILHPPEQGGVAHQVGIALELYEPRWRLRDDVCREDPLDAFQEGRLEGARDHRVWLLPAH